ncbi:hypothetical protein C9374_006003 [Naegleria lovaniensis]|uniref:Uncharacterized protein n=1 Tax=Naegleria lovaniensis TaxID=51637 RepID=A0AA88KHC2_NAELO|nr:uncharacterized protein C9374_006003 [Naegleria lovaniensis]KAG2381619.1 hypothetical protein C9374_006003 [Naegleria lovaniensis]
MVDICPSHNARGFTPRVILALLLLCLILLWSSSLATATSCPAGYFDSGNIEHPCYECSVGHYCPGDGHSYECANGTISNQIGLSTCLTCASQRTNSDHTVCLLPDTPQDAREFSLKHVLEIDNHNPYLYTTLRFSEIGESNPFQYIQLTFLNSRAAPMLVYASTVTGQPSPQQSFQYFASGLNATIAVPNPRGRSIGVILYLHVVSLNARKSAMLVQPYNYLDLIYTLQPGSNFIQTSSELALYSVDNEVLLTYPKIPPNANVELQISAREGFNDKISFVLCYSSKIPQRFPNYYNSDTFITSSYKENASALLRTNFGNDGGYLAVALIFKQTFWNGKINVDFKIMSK